MDAISFHSGGLFDIWYLRARFGMGFSQMRNSVTVNGDSADSTNFDFTYMFGLGGMFFRDNDFQMGLEARAFLNPALETAYFALAFTGTYDLLHF